MLRTFNDFMKAVKNFEDSRDLWLRMSKVSNDDSFYHEKAKGYEEDIKELCKKYPTFASMYKLNKERGRA